MSAVNREDYVERFIRPGDLVVVADGVGAPSSACLAEMSRAARLVGDVSLLLGWCIGSRPGLDLDAFASVRTCMAGYALRRAVQSGQVDYLPIRLGTMPARLADVLRPDVLVAAMTPRGNGFSHATEVGWTAAAARQARHVLVELRHGPTASAVADLPAAHVHVVGDTDEPPDQLPRPVPDDSVLEIGRLVADLVPEGAAVQVGPGVIAEAFLRALRIPVMVDSGVLVDGVMDLESRGLLLGEPTAAYLAGTADLYSWADGRAILHGVERTHDVTRLSSRPLVAVNTALEIDLTGQVNVEGVQGDPVAGIGGHADYALAASRSGGASVIAVPTARGGHPTLVERLDTPTSTTRADVDVVVTERGVADLRGLPDERRREALLRLWDGVPR